MRRPVAPEGPVDPAFLRRAERAEALASQAGAAEWPLRFAAGLYRVQGRMATSLAASPDVSPLRGRLGEDLEVLLPGCTDLLRFAAAEGPPLLKGQAEERLERWPSLARSRLIAYWHGEAGADEDYLSRALLRPYVEVLARLARSPDRRHLPGRCPFCGGSAWVAARRAEADGDGARRLLGCALCAGEWHVGRVLCPCCGEEDPKRLPSFHSDTHPLVRIEACETCRRYVKSIDLTLDARPIPEVDDLASLAMDLWAAREGFRRIEPGLAGI